MASKTQKTLFGVAAALAGVFGLLWFTRKADAASSAAHPVAPQLPEHDGGTQDEPPTELPAKPAVAPRIGNDKLPRYSTAVIATSTGPVQFEKEFDTDKGEIRWISFKDGRYGSYKDIVALDTNHPVMMIYTADGAALWENGRITAAGQRELNLPPGAPIKALK